MSTPSYALTNLKRAIVLISLFLVFLFAATPLAGSKVNGSSKVSGVTKEGYIGVEACRKCHEEYYRKFKDTKMGKIILSNPRTPLEAEGCESCHGPGRAHSLSGGNVQQIIRFGDHPGIPKEPQTQQCLQCHERGGRMFWQGSQHESRGLTCTSCHQAMMRNTQTDRFVEPLTEKDNFVKATREGVCFQCHQLRRAQLLRSSHMPFREGKITCINCHNPHGTPNPKLLIESTPNENCYKCHAERRGPFLWEHPPAMENCLNCHDAHGSNNPQLLKARSPRLCQNCHIEARHPTTPQLATTRFAFNRGCTNCHSQIHGSNHPSGMRFQR
jgi:DmsE family decaheme c-type cytochrome